MIFFLNHLKGRITLIKQSGIPLNILIHFANIYMTKANKLKKKKFSNCVDKNVLEDKLQKEYIKSIHNELEESDNQFKLEDKCIDCYERMKEYILNCGLMIGQNLNCQNLINFVKPEKEAKPKVYKDFKLEFINIKRKI